MKLEEWLKENTFHHTSFSHKKRLVELKERKGQRISVALPTLNEEKTIGKEIVIIKGELMDRYPLVDEIAIIDSGSTDRTIEVAAEFGADVYRADDYLPEFGVHHGKGENLWKSLYLLSGDIIVWIDADIGNIHPKFVYAVVGPLLEYDHIGYVKAFYERPLHVGDKIRATGGGRVTQILIRPLFAAFYPDLTGFLQPLSGEYAGRREILERMPFSVGYGVETGLLIDIYEKYGLECMAQVDLDRRIHRNQDLASLGRMAFSILHTVLSKLEQKEKIQVKEAFSKELYLIKAQKKDFFLKGHPLRLVERPPMITVAEYRKKRGIREKDPADQTRSDRLEC